ATTKDGTPVTAWATAAGLKYHIGLETSSPDLAVPLAGCCARDPEVAFDASGGQAYLAWFSTAPRKQGVLVQAIGAAGAWGTRFYAPGSARKNRTAAVVPGQRTALTGRIGGDGVYLAYGRGYPSVQAVALLRIGAATPVVGIPAPGAREVSIAAAPQGRLWL